MKLRHLISAAVSIAFLSMPHADAQNNLGNGFKKIGRTIKDAVTETARDAKDVIVENTGNNSRSNTPRSSKTIAYYVSIQDGSNRNDGLTKETPLKNIQKAIDLASDSSVILVAEGNYYGILNSGNINITKPLSIYGGYSPDFSDRDVLKHRTVVSPSPESNDTQDGQGTVQIQVRKINADIIIDGLLFDRGNTIAYNPEPEEVPEGICSPSMIPVGTAGVGGADLTNKKVITASSAIMYLDRVLADVVIRNCAFVNAPDYAIRGLLEGKVSIQNNIFINVRNAAVEISGCNILKNGTVEFKNNTILFSWPRNKELQDMGYGYRYMTKIDSYLDGNIIGLTTAGLDRTHVDTPSIKESERVTTIENSIFFLNKKADLVIPGGNTPLKVSAKDFEDVTQLAKVSGNKVVSDPAVFEGAINEAYLKGFQDNTTYANRYPFEEALKLFGAVEEYGAQVIR